MVTTLVQSSEVQSSEVQGFRGSRVQRFKGSEVQRFGGSRVQGFGGSRVQGSTVKTMTASFDSETNSDKIGINLESLNPEP